MSLEAYLTGQSLGQLQSNNENTNISDLDSIQINPHSEDIASINSFPFKNEHQNSSIGDLLGHNEESYVDQQLGAHFAGSSAIDYGAHYQVNQSTEDVTMVSDGDEDESEEDEDDDDDEDNGDENEEGEDDEEDGEEENQEDVESNKKIKLTDLVNEVKPMINTNLIEQSFMEDAGPIFNNTAVIQPQNQNVMPQPGQKEAIDEKKARIMANVDSILNAVAKDEMDSYISQEVPMHEGDAAKDKPKKTRKRKKNQDEKKEKKKKKVKPSNLRKNIREVKEDLDLESTTIAAQTEEMERKKRLQEIKKSILEKEKEKEKEKDSQLKSLLEDDEDDKSSEVILLDSSDEGKNKKKESDVIDISSDEDDVMLGEDNDEDLVDSEDPNNAGSHIDDSLNHPDEEGRVLINIGHPPDEPDIFLAPQIAKYIKRHQIGGVRFLYDNLIESLSRFKSSPGFGCILAHSMGLGKTIQMISLIDVFLRHTSAKSVLLIVPINTLQNWLAEINMWCPESVPEGYPDVQLRNFKVYILNDNFKTPLARAKVIVEWFKTGGVMLMGYEMYRLMTSRKGHIQQPKKGRKAANKEMVIDVEEEDKTKDMFVDVHEALQNPGPDMIVCDEGHRIKNSHAGISQSLKNIKTRRRVVLTGYPLQNNLIEYWCMVDFVRPNYLGNKTEFCNMFERPIMNGQCADSTDSDIKLMRFRAHVLHSLLEGFVQRRGHTVLQAALPPKQEYILLITMSQVQKMLYKEFMDNLAETSLNTWATTNPIKAFSVCCKIWNHPDVLYKILKQKKLDLAEDNDLDIETGETSGGKKKGKKQSAAGSPATSEKVKSDQSITYEWAEKVLKDYVPGLLETGGKMMLLFELIRETLAVGDKMLIFSQSLYTLSLIEDLLSKCKVPRPDIDEYWAKNRNYFRLDGSTLAQEREKLITQFNAYDNNRVWLFLLSTRAGSLGINLIGANRVVVMDASWNPCHDCQAVCRVYRFGQMKPCYIYRMVTDNTMEKKIYDRQVNKQGMSDRVVDELNPQNNFCRSQVDNLLRYEDVETDPIDFSESHNEFDDEVMVNVIKRQGQWLTKKPFTHESLLIDKKELRLSKKEKRLAKQSYVMEKRLNLTYTRPSYAAFYPKGGGPQVRHPQPPWNQQSSFNRPVASVKPIMSTPVPMKAKDGVSVIPQTKPGVTVHKIVTTTDITLPGTSTATQSGGSASGSTITNKIPAGQQVFVIKTPKGVYIRTKEGKIFAVRAKTPLVSGLSSGSPSSVTTVTVKSSTSGPPKVGTAQPIIVYPKNGSAVINRNPTSRQPRVIKSNVPNKNSQNDSKSDAEKDQNKDMDTDASDSNTDGAKNIKIVDISSVKKSESNNIAVLKTTSEPKTKTITIHLPTSSSVNKVSSLSLVSVNSDAKVDSVSKISTDTVTVSKSSSQVSVEGVSRKNTPANLESAQRKDSHGPVPSVSRSSSQASIEGIPRHAEFDRSNSSNSANNVSRQNSYNSQLSSSDDGPVQFENNDSMFGSEFGAFDQSDNSNMSNTNSQYIDLNNQSNSRQPGFLESLFDDSDILPFTQNMRQDSSKPMSRIDSSASLSSNMGHIDLRDESDKMTEDNGENMDTFMSRYPRIAPNSMRQNYQQQQQQQQQQQHNPMSHMYNPLSGFNQGQPQMGYNPMYPPYPVLFPPHNSHSQQNNSSQDASGGSTTQNDFRSPLQNMSQLASSPMMPGFPFSPYPFPMPSPYMMGGMGNPYMPMGMPSAYGHQGNMMPPSSGMGMGQQNMMHQQGYGQQNMSQQQSQDSESTQ